MITTHGFEPPPFCSFTPEQWKSMDHEYDEIAEGQSELISVVENICSYTKTYAKRAEIFVSE